MKVTILTIFKQLYQGEIKEATLPGQEGEVCIMDFHQPFLHRLRSGYIQLTEAASKSKNTQKHRFKIRDGIATMKANELALLVAVA
ncbi:MAG: hypothetical protein JW734_04415 [Candidatus Omnitrophica bacterium]|nr:hypothetical protein [Candidatus Omnitrophota bacterium]